MNAPSASKRPIRKSRKGLYIGLLIATALLAGGGYFLWQKLLRKPGLEEQYIVATVQRGDIEDLVTATGTLQPRDYVDVGAQVSGQLKEFHVEVGSTVQAGDLLAEIDATVFSAKVDASRAQLRSQRAQLADRESTAALAELQLQRQKNLMASDATTREALQNAEASLRSARAQIESLRAQIEQNESSLRADEANLNYARIYAPMAGTVVSITARKGQTLNTNQQAPTLLRIADMSTMTVQTQVSEADVSKLRENMDAYFTTLGNPERRWFGKLRKVEPTPVVQSNVVLFNALFDVPNPNQALMPQMTAQVFFVVASVSDKLLVPASAITRVRSPRGANSGSNNETSAASGPAASSPVASRNEQENRSAQTARPARERSADSAGPAAGNDGENRRMRQRPPMDGDATNMPDAESQERRARMRERMAAMDSGAGASGPTDGQRRPRMRREGESGPAAGAWRRDEQRMSRSDSADGGAARGNSDRTTERSGERQGARPNARRAQSAGGLSNASTIRRAPRPAKVRVINAQGQIEEREIMVGVSNRVQIEVVSGLQEGERVIAGTRVNDKERASTTNQNRQQPGGLQGGGMPPQGGAPGGIRR